MCDPVSEPLASNREQLIFTTHHIEQRASSLTWHAQITPHTHHTPPHLCIAAAAAATQVPHTYTHSGAEHTQSNPQLVRLEFHAINNASQQLQQHQ